MAPRWSEGTPRAYREGREVIHPGSGAGLSAACHVSLALCGLLPGWHLPPSRAWTEFCWNGLVVSAMRRHTGKVQRLGGGAGETSVTLVSARRHYEARGSGSADLVVKCSCLEAAGGS